MSSALDRLKNLTNKISSYELSRKSNKRRLQELFVELEINNKVQDFQSLFDFKAINLSGVSLLHEDLGAIKEGKYLQILAISYDKNATVKSKNISLAYFGRVESVEHEIKNSVVEFVLRYRFEKSFMTLEHYHSMLSSFGKVE
ncbi:hypothetical protein [Sulfurimonas sp.]